MIITFTPNPSLDRTVTIDGPLNPGSVHRITSDSVDPGGKGINVGLGIARAGLEVVAVFPASRTDPLLSLLEREQLTFSATPTAAPVRTNLAVISEPVLTTKINEPGTGLTRTELAALIGNLLELAEDGDQVMMAGSLAPQMPSNLYTTLIRKLRAKGAWVGVDTADETLVSLFNAGPEAAPDFLKPNAHELGQLTGFNGDELERSVLKGDLAQVLSAALQLRSQGVDEVLVTLGPAGALLACKEGAWYSPSPDVPVISTVGAGDSSVAGYLIGRQRGLGAPERLALAVAYGAAAAALPGTVIPFPDQVTTLPELVRSL